LRNALPPLASNDLFGVVVLSEIFPTRQKTRKLDAEIARSTNVAVV
jgi:hypothetical protein